MALTDIAQYRAKINSPFQVVQDSKISLTTILGRPSSLFVTTPFAGAAPTTAVVPTNSRANGFLGQRNAGAEKLRLGRLAAAASQTGVFLLCDRLSHQGGLAGNVATSQTTNLATAALTRYTSGSRRLGSARNLHTDWDDSFELHCHLCRPRWEHRKHKRRAAHRSDGLSRSGTTDSDSPCCWRLWNSFRL
jgi:hypothetical protein